MGMLINGRWQSEGHFPTSEDGAFRRKPTTFREAVQDSPVARFPAAAGRYHLYVSLACPWAHRTLILRSLRGLQEAISVSVVDPYMGPEGWHFSDGPGCVPDSVLGHDLLREVYVSADPSFTGRVTVPVLWDRQTASIVNNESTEIIRMFNQAFSAQAEHPEVDLWPEGLRDASDAMREAMYERFNNGVYRAGFARSQGAYEVAVREVFEVLDQFEEVLGRQRYLVSDERIVEADICAFTTLLRFDPVYHGHFKCNLRRIVDLPNVWGYLRDLYQTPRFRETCDMDHIKQHYYRSHESVNPSGVVPLGPVLDLDAPHGRGA